MKTNTLTPELLHKMDAYWRAADYRSLCHSFGAVSDHPELIVACVFSAAEGGRPTS